MVNAASSEHIWLVHCMITKLLAEEGATQKNFRMLLVVDLMYGNGVVGLLPNALRCSCIIDNILATDICYSITAVGSRCRKIAQSKGRLK